MCRVITSSNNFAIYLTRKTIQGGFTINVTKLQKMLFACYGHFLAESEDKLFDEHPEAWQYGPVFPSVRANYDNILQIACQTMNDEEPAWAKETPLVGEVVDFVLSHVGSWTASQLVTWSHQKGSPWSVTTHNGDIEYLGLIIMDDVIRKYFSDEG